VIFAEVSERSMSFFRGVFVAATIAAIGLSGCGGAPKGGEMGQAPAELREVNDLLRQVGAASGKAPGKMSDLDKAKDNFVMGHAAVKSGKVVVIWNTRFAGEGDVGKNEIPVAYEKDVPTAGGFVLLSAGSIKKMSADEFKAAKK
jgi:hypothetical protein